MYLDSDGPNSVNQKGGLFTWGGIDKENCEEVRGWTPLTHEAYYEFEMEVGSSTLDEHNPAFSRDFRMGKSTNRRSARK